jgi:hypothetical protein
MRAIPLTASTQAILDGIRTYAWTLNVYGMSQSRAVRLVKARTEIRINRAGIAPPFNNVYRRYVLELVKTFRTRTGGQLALAIPLVIRKWANLGLAVPLLEELLGDCFLRFEQHGYSMPKPKKLGKPVKAQRRRRMSYEQALATGRARLRGGNTAQEQAALQQQGAARASAIARALKPVLAERGITGRAIIPYYNFAQQLGRLSRKYSGKSLQMAMLDLVDLYEAKSLDGDVLAEIAHSLFDIPDLS